LEQRGKVVAILERDGVRFDVLALVGNVNDPDGLFISIAATKEYWFKSLELQDYACKVFPSITATAFISANTNVMTNANDTTLTPKSATH